MTTAEVTLSDEKMPWRPLAVGAALLLGTLVWAWSAHQDAQARAEFELARHAESLAQGVSVLVQQSVVQGTVAEQNGRIAGEFAEHLQLRRPMQYARLERDGRTIATAGTVPNGGSSGVGAADGAPLVAWTQELFGSRARPDGGGEARGPRPNHPGPPPGASPGLAPGASPGPPPGASPGLAPGDGPGPGPPWEWLVRGDGPPDGGVGDVTAGFRLVVGMDAGMPPSFASETRRRILTTLLLAWAAIGAAVWMWIRESRSRRLFLALEAERREREVLRNMNLAAAGMAHETKNPLGIIFGLAQRLAADASVSESARGAAESIMDEADRATARLSDYMNFARTPSPKVASVDVSAVVRRIVSALGPEFQERGVRLNTALAPVVVECDETMVEQLLVNLLLNSLDACSAGCTTEIRLVAGDGTARLEITDDGEGVDAGIEATLFEPYVTGRPDGHGLGLAIVKRIVDQHRWAIRLGATPQGGAAFVVTGIRVAGASAAGTTMETV